jgi:hypothetical protein
VTRFSIVDAKLHHCGKISRRLRRAHHEAGLRLGLNAHRELRTVLAESSYAKVCFANDELIAMGGVIGSLISPLGFVWLAITEEGARRYPIALAREARKQLDLIMRTKVEGTRRLSTSRSSSDSTSRTAGPAVQPSPGSGAETWRAISTSIRTCGSPSATVSR